MTTRPNIEELDRLWEEANRKRAFDMSNPARGIEEQVSAANRYAAS